MAKEKKSHKGLRMTDSMKQKYAQLFLDELDTLEAHEFKMPWVNPRLGAPCNIYRQGKPYRKSNAIFLTMLVSLKGWNTPLFITKTQMENEDGKLKYDGLRANATPILDEDGMVTLDKRGMPAMDYERRFPVIYYRPLHYDADGNKISDEDWDMMSFDEQRECKTWFVQKTYGVYNIDQTNFKELYPDDYAEFQQTPEHDYKEGVHDEVLEMMIAGGAWRCPIFFGGTQSCFNVTRDEIHLPKREHFLGDEQFYATALHEMAHSTGKELGRDQHGVFGTEDYAMEEFVAELSSACVCSMLGIGKLLDENHIAYVDSWRRALKTNKDFIPVVIDDVQKAVNYILRKYDAVAEDQKHPRLLTVSAA